MPEVSHSAIGASSMYRWKMCPGSIRESKGAPHLSNEYAELGTHAHEVASEILLGRKTFAYYEMIEDPELMEAVALYLGVVQELQERCHLVKIEHGFDMTALYPGLFGTTDCYAYHAHSKTLYVIDYKHGKSKVEVENNSQLLYYALGALLSLPHPVDVVRLMVVQPRAPGDKIRSWDFPVTDIYDFIAELLAAAKATEAPDAPLLVGKWCFFCPVVSSCPAQHAERNKKAKEQFSAI